MIELAAAQRVEREAERQHELAMAEELGGGCAQQ